MSNEEMSRDRLERKLEKIRTHLDQYDNDVFDEEEAYNNIKREVETK